ncbi:nucleoside deaminase [Oceanicola sp. 22II-s10i]|uniref:nucleoside deaminase n=1 Tax=Oceanicola sp. 22II-s10i TaxID=1317116 RepID=UPI000B5294AF|nr:nucleoside deaminase [Oceanicola sp. 22II-s10i]
MPELSPITEAEDAVLVRINTRARELAGDGAKAGIVAAVMRGEEVLALGENEVHLKHDPTRHAEIVAISRAAEGLGHSDLSGCTLLSSLQPCEMCLAAMRFAGIDRVIFAAGKAHVAGKYFMFPGLDLDDFRQAAKGGFTAFGPLREAEVIKLYEDAQE